MWDNQRSADMLRFPKFGKTGDRWNGQGIAQKLVSKNLIII